MDPSKPSLSHLRALLAKATPGPWEMSLDGRKLVSWTEPCRTTFDRVAYADEVDPDDLKFVAAANPTAVLALITIAEAAVRLRKASDANYYQAYDDLLAATKGIEP